MTPAVQTLAALLIVAAAAVGLVLRWSANRRKPGCGGGCGCPTDELKDKVRSRDRAAGMKS
jgi:hypothetical protein